VLKNPHILVDFDAPTFGGDWTFSTDFRGGIFALQRAEKRGLWWCCIFVITIKMTTWHAASRISGVPFDLLTNARTDRLDNGRSASTSPSKCHQATQSP
jgi:hypothetical protein